MFHVKVSRSFCPSISMSRRIGTRASICAAFSWITAGSWSSKLNEIHRNLDLLGRRIHTFQVWLDYISVKPTSVCCSCKLSHHRGKVLFLSRPILLRLMVVEQGTASKWWELLGSVGTHWLLLFAFCSLIERTKTHAVRKLLAQSANRMSFPNFMDSLTQTKLFPLFPSCLFSKTKTVTNK